MSQVVCSDGEAQPLVEVDREHGLRAVVGEPLEQLGEVRDPERGLEPGPYFLPALREAHTWPPTVERGGMIRLGGVLPHGKGEGEQQIVTSVLHSAMNGAASRRERRA